MLHGIVPTITSGQMKDLASALVQAIPSDLPSQRAQWLIQNKGKIQRALREFLVPTDLQEQGSALIEKEVSLDTIVCVERSDHSVYPFWATNPLHPELETVGPSHYDLAQVQLYVYESHWKGDKRMKGTQVYQHLKGTDRIKDCLDFHDALQIQKKGVEVFDRLFKGKKLFCWKSVQNGAYLEVPYVQSDNGKVVVDWWRTVNNWYEEYPAALFPS